MENTEIKQNQKLHSYVITFISIVPILFILNILSYTFYDHFFKPDNNSPQVDSYNTETESTSTCNVLGINLHGGITTYVSKEDKEKDVVASEYITSFIEHAEEDSKIKGILFEVDSFGGLPVAGEEVANSLKNSKKPTVALIRQSGLSAAYWASTGADYIFASKNSDVGSIGVTSSYLENINTDKKFIQLSLGKFKDSSNPDKPITEEEKDLIMRDVKIVYQNFIQAVANNRNLSIEQVMKVADGSSFLGERAKELGLIDAIGGISEAKVYLKNEIGQDVEICWVD